jgi:hypothetical protein
VICVSFVTLVAWLCFIHLLLNSLVTCKASKKHSIGLGDRLREGKG